MKFIYPGIVPLVIGRLSLTLITPTFTVFHTCLREENWKVHREKPLWQRREQYFKQTQFI